MPLGSPLESMVTPGCPVIQRVWANGRPPEEREQVVWMGHCATRRMVQQSVYDGRGTRVTDWGFKEVHLGKYRDVWR